MSQPTLAAGASAVLGTIAPRVTAVEACARALREAILGSTFAPGASLPPERELAQTLGVNRTTLRGALGQLEAARLLTVRQGSGTVVRDWRREGGPDLVGDLVRLAGARGTRRVAADLLLLRRALAAAILPRVFEAKEPALRRVELAIDAFARAAEAKAAPDALAQADLDVVGALVAAAGSEVLGLCTNPVLQLVRGLPELCAALYREPGANVLAWRGLLELVRVRQVEALPGFAAAIEELDAQTLRWMGADGERARTVRRGPERKRRR